jgi:peptidoglycan hydrolase-like protein with peptidoglycan-binding domain
MAKDNLAFSALLCASVMLGACGMWSDRDSGRSGQSSGRSSATVSPGSGGQSSTQISQVQQAVKAKGYDPGTTDGKMGAQTQEALRRFQKANGLPVTGMVDSQTAKALGVSSSGSGSTSSGATGSSSEGRSSTGSGSSSSRDSSGSSTGTGSSSGSSRSGEGSSGSGSGRSGSGY